MTSESFGPRLWRGILIHPKRVVANLALAFTGSWAFIEPVVTLANVSQYHDAAFTFLVCISLTTALAMSAVPRSITINIPGLRHPVRVACGDIFSFDGHKVIPVNDYFDGQIGDRVSKQSLHGQCIEKVFGGDALKFENAVDLALITRSNVEEPRRTSRQRKYPIGTIAPVNIGDKKVLLVALSKSDPETHKASADIDELVIAIRSAIEGIRAFGNGDPAAIPLLGGGLSGVKLSSKALLHQLLIMLLRASRDHHIESPITIVLHETVFSSVDLSEYNYTNWN